MSLSLLLRRIDTLLKAKGLSERKACQQANLGVDAIRTIRRGHEPKISTLVALADALGVAPDHLIGPVMGGGRSLAQGLPAPDVTGASLVEINDTEYAAIGRFDAQLSAGPGSLLEHEPEPLGYHLIEAQWLQAVTRTAPQHMAVVRVAGDSMETTLFDGDWVLLDRLQNRASREGIYGLRVGFDLWVKRLTLDLEQRKILILSDNPAYPPQRLVEDDLQVVGRVCWIVARKV